MIAHGRETFSLAHLLSREELAALVPFSEYVDAVADAFRMHAEGRALLPPPMHIRADSGGFHVKAGLLPIGPGYAAFKVNANFPDNRAKHALPTIQGAILLFDASNGLPVALLDSIEITIQRTGAATAVALRYLARPESRSATIFGCGAQAAALFGHIGDDKGFRHQRRLKLILFRIVGTNCRNERTGSHIGGTKERGARRRA